MEDSSQNTCPDEETCFKKENLIFNLLVNCEAAVPIGKKSGSNFKEMKLYEKYYGYLSALLFYKFVKKQTTCPIPVT